MYLYTYIYEFEIDLCILWMTVMVVKELVKLFSPFVFSPCKLDAKPSSSVASIRLKPVEPVGCQTVSSLSLFANQLILKRTKQQRIVGIALHRTPRSLTLPKA